MSADRQGVWVYTVRGRLDANTTVGRTMMLTPSQYASQAVRSITELRTIELLRDDYPEVEPDWYGWHFQPDF